MTAEEGRLAWLERLVAVALDTPGGPDPVLLEMLAGYQPFPTYEQELEHRGLVVAFWLVRCWSERAEEVEEETTLELR